MTSVILHDERLSGNTPDWSDTVGFTVDEDDPIDRVLGWVNATHGMLRRYDDRAIIEDLAIMCHGYVNGKNQKGGHGLQLGKDGVYLSNIDKWSAIKSKVKCIIVYACKAAAVDPTVPANQGDGRALCSKMAAVTGASIIACVWRQWYDRSIKPWRWREIDFGGFEGPVFVFRPDGTITNAAPWMGSDTTPDPTDD